MTPSRKVALACIAVLLLIYWLFPGPGKVLNKVRTATQYPSVRGAESLLHSFDVPAWADGSALRTGIRSLDMSGPAGGMNTAVTVIMCCLATGILLHIRRYKLAVIAAAGILQVLVLNILLITVVTVSSSNSSLPWADATLPYSQNVLLLTAVLLTQLELVFLNMAIVRKRKKKEEPILLPPFWQVLIRWKWAFIAVVLLVAATAVTAHKRKPYHRSQMISSIVADLAIADLDSAEHAALASLDLNGANHLLRAELARMLLLRRSYDEALDELRKIPFEKRSPFVIMEAWALMGKGQTRKAAILLDSMLKNKQALGDTAIVRAELAVSQDHPGSAAKNVVMAVGSLKTIERVRTLFPYLAMRKQWKAIAECHRKLEYDDQVIAFIAAIAFLRTHDFHGADSILRKTAMMRPKDPILLGLMLELAVLRPGSEWEELFEKSFKEALDILDIDQLALFLFDCFALTRPDLAWTAYDSIESRDPDDPVLCLAPGRFGDVWFTFRRHKVNMPAADSEATVDLSPLLMPVSEQPDSLVGHKKLQNFVRGAPLGVDFSSGSLRDKRKRYLQRYLTKHERRKRKGTLTDRMKIMHSATVGDGKPEGLLTTRLLFETEIAKRAKALEGPVRILEKVYAYK